MNSVLNKQVFRKCRLLLFCSVLLLTACPPPPNSKASVQHFQLLLALSEPLGEMGSSLPDDIKSMFKPLETANCSGFLFVPDVTVVRIDLPNAKPEELDLGKSQELNSWERSLGKAVTVQQAQTVREKALANLTVSGLMAQPKGPMTSTNEPVRVLLSRSSSKHIFATSNIQERVGPVAGADKVTVAREVAELLVKMGEKFCSKASEVPKVSDCLVIYGTGSVTPSPTPTVAPPPAQSSNRDTLESQMSLKQGMIYVTQKKYAQAVKEFRHSTEVDPKNAYGWANLCGAYLSLGDQEQAQITCSQAIEIDPKNWQAHYNFGSLYARLNRKQEAIRSLSQALDFVAADQTLPITKAEVIQQIKEDSSLTPLRNDPNFKKLLAGN